MKLYKALLLHYWSDFDETWRIMHDLKWHISACNIVMLRALVERLFVEMLKLTAQTNVSGPLTSFLCHTCLHTLMSASNKQVAGCLRRWPHPCGTLSQPALTVYTNPTFMLITFMMIKRPRWWEGEGEQLCPPLQNKHIHTNTHPFVMLITAFTIRQTVITPFVQRGDP